MLKYPPLAFIQEKILELQYALFYDCSNSVLKIPNQVVNALYVDDLGQVWFLIQSPIQSIVELDKEFSARLDFYKKGKQFYLKAAGRAFIVHDPEELNSLSCIPDAIKEKSMYGKVILLKIKIQHAEYFESDRSMSSYWFGKIKNDLYKWFSFQQNGQGKLASKRIAVDQYMQMPGIYSN